MNSYTLAFAILGSGILTAAILWSLPKLRCRRQVRQFRRELSHVDVVTLAWRESLPGQDPSDDVPVQSHEARRSRRNRRHEPPAPV